MKAALSSTKKMSRTSIVWTRRTQSKRHQSEGLVEIVDRVPEAEAAVVDVVVAEAGVDTMVAAVMADAVAKGDTAAMVATEEIGSLIVDL